VLNESRSLRQLSKGENRNALAAEGIQRKFLFDTNLKTGVGFGLDYEFYSAICLLELSIRSAIRSIPQG